VTDERPPHHERAEEIRRVANAHGARRVRVFGSRLRGEAGKSSDLVALKQDLEQLLGCHVDVVEEEGLSPYLRQRVRDEAQIS